MAANFVNILESIPLRVAGGVRPTVESTLQTAARFTTACPAAHTESEHKAGRLDTSYADD
jgi:hypothetical protein